MRIQELREEKTDKPIVLVFGRLCSGKGTYCQKYEREGYTHFTTSDIVKRVSGAVSREELQRTGDMDQAILEAMVNEIEIHKPVVIDGIRQVSIIQGLMDQFGEDQIHMIWLEVPSEIRRQRFADRSASKDTKSFDDSEAGDDKLGLSDVESFVKDKSQIVNHY